MNKKPRGKLKSVTAKIQDKAVAALCDDKEMPLVVGYDGEPDFCLSTRLPSLDIISGKGKDGSWGVPCGSTVGIMGISSAGKSSLGCNLMASAQAKGLWVNLIESEGILSPKFMQIHGVNLETILRPKEPPETKEDAYELVRRLLKRTLTSGLVVIDSTSALQTIEERDQASIADRGSAASHARINSKAMRILTPLLRKTKCILVLIAQSKDDIGFGKFHAKTTLGGSPVRFHSAVFYEITRTGWLKVKEGEPPAGMKCDIKVLKTKVGVPLRAAKDIILNFVSGFDIDLSLHQALVDSGLVTRSVKADKAGKGHTFTFIKPTASGKVISYNGEKGIKTLDPKLKQFLATCVYKKSK